jgi:MFS transporter, FHS family, glucose/mannose:H+ symporter
MFPLYIGFVLMGICATILGPILPALSARWNMNDTHAGTLFTAQFVGSSLGGLLAAIHPRKSTLIGLVAAAAALAALAVAPPLLAIPVLFFFGLGVGLALTGINLTASSTSGPKRGVTLSWLNFFWSLGATICPILAGAFIAHRGLVAFLLILPVWCLCMAVSIAIRGGMRSNDALLPPQSAETTERSVWFFVAYFAALLFLYAGVETALGGWLSTLATRLHHEGSSGAFALSVSSFFWMALLAGRALSPVLLKCISEKVLQPAAIALSILSVCLLLFARSYADVAIAGGLAGFSLAPVFPLSLSFYLARADQSRKAGVVFAICGLGGAVLPWMTGAVSTCFRSLQWGLCIPLAGAVLMLGLSLNYVLFIRTRISVESSVSS